MATLRPNAGSSKNTPLPLSPNTASLSPSPTSGHTSPGSPSTTATSAAPTGLPSDEEVEAVIKQATSTRPTPDGRPPPGKDTRTQLFTGNLPYRVRWQDLKDLFRRAGTVLRADVSLTPDNRSRGYGTVLLASAEDAGRAVDMFNGYNWQGRVLEVRLDRLGNVPGADLDANPATLVSGVGMSGVTSLSAVNGLAPNLGAMNGLHVPLPHAALPYVTQSLSGSGQSMGVSPALLSTTSSLSAASVNISQNTSPLNTLNPGMIALQQQQKAQQEREREEFLINQHAPGRPALGGLDPFFGTLGRGLSADLDRDQSRSSLGMRSLFVGNLPFHCQWQDLKDLFRQAGTILRADVSLGADGRSRGFGTVTFANEIDAERAVAIFNGFDYNGRVLKVHYDRFSSQSPLPPTLSPHPSNLATPVQPNAAFTQAALLQAAQLQQLVSEQTYDRFSNLSGFSTISNGSNGNSDGTPSGVAAHSPALAMHDTFPVQPQSRPATSSGSGYEHRPRVSSMTSESVSPFSVHLPGTSPSLAERRQKVPPPIGTVSASTSRRGSAGDTNAGGNAEGRNFNVILSASAAGTGLLNTSPALPTKDKRPTGQSLPVSSASLPLTVSEGSSTSDAKRPVTSSSVPALGSIKDAAASNTTSAEPSSNQSTQSTCTSPRSSHPAHPGPISLPPPPPVSSFPLYSPHHHPMSPPGHPMSPPVYAGYPSYGPMSPMHPYPLPAHMHPANMTPHGLPPITPSMPSFSFVPQPSPGVPAGGSSAIPPTPAEGGAPLHEGYPQPGQPGDANGNPMARGMSMMPMMSPPLHLPHHVFQPFTPGAAMSPGAFYGHPNGGAPRGSYLNPAVGSPVLMHPPYGFPPHPGSQPGSPYYFQNPNGGQYGEEPNGYFPPVGAQPPPPPQPPRHEGYFPPVSALGSSGLANEILRDGSSMNMEGYEHNYDREGERPVHERNDSGSTSGPTSSDNGPGEDTDAERARSSSSGATSWRSADGHASEIADTGADSSKGASLENLAQDMASLRFGSPPKGRPAKRGEASYAAAASSMQRTESVDDNTGYPPVKPPALQKTHSDETAGHMRVSVGGGSGS